MPFSRHFRAQTSKTSHPWAVWATQILWWAGLMILTETEQMQQTQVEGVLQLLSRILKAKISRTRSKQTLQWEVSLWSHLALRHRLGRTLTRTYWLWRKKQPPCLRLTHPKNFQGTSRIIRTRETILAIVLLPIKTWGTIYPTLIIVVTW